MEVNNCRIDGSATALTGFVLFASTLISGSLIQTLVALAGSLAGVAVVTSAALAAGVFAILRSIEINVNSHLTTFQYDQLLFILL